MSYSGSSPVAGAGVSTGDQIQAWFEENAAAGAAYVGLPEAPIEPGIGNVIEAFGRLWRVNWDLLAALCAHESAWFQSRICRDKNNPGGFGAENHDPYNLAVTFDSLADGVRAVAAHLAGYVHGAGPWNQYSSRYAIVRDKGWAGSVQVLTDLNGKWAWPGETYGQSLARIANDLVVYHVLPQTPGGTVSALPVRVSHIPATNANRPGRKMTPRYITIHETANTSVGANAEMHRRFTHNGGGAEGVSFHDVIDDREIVELLPDGEVGIHAGSRQGNDESIGIEICVNADGDFTKALALAARRVAQRMQKHSIPLERVVQHNHWSGKGCPARLRQGDNWGRFIAQVAAHSKETPVAETVNGLKVEGPILTYWNTNGREKLIGVPIGEQKQGRAEDGKEVLYQDFDKLRIEVVLGSGEVRVNNANAEALRLRTMLNEDDAYRAVKQIQLLVQGID